MKIITFLLIFSLDCLAIDEADLKFIQSLNQFEQVQLNKDKEEVSKKTNRNAFRKEFLAHIKKGRKLYRMQDGTTVFTDKALDVRAYRLINDELYTYILDTKGETLFKIMSQDIEDIKPVTTLYEKPEKFIAQTPKVEKVIPNSLDFNALITAQLGYSDGAFISDLSNESFGGGIVQRYELALVSNFDLKTKLAYPIQYGAAIGFETMSGRTKSNKLETKTITFAPNVFYDFEEFTAYFKIGFSLFSELTFEAPEKTSSIPFSNSIFNIGFYKSEPVQDLGRASWGFNFQRNWVRAYSDDINLNLSSSNKPEDSLAFTIGFIPSFI